MFSTSMTLVSIDSRCFFFTDPATTEIYTLSLHDALPIWRDLRVRQRLLGVHVSITRRRHFEGERRVLGGRRRRGRSRDRKSTRLNSSHVSISYAVFCLKKKKKRINTPLKDIRTDRIYVTT